MKFKNIKARRAELNLTQEQVARAANIGLRHYQGIEYGDTIPGMAVASRVAAALDTSIERLWEIGGKAV